MLDPQPFWKKEPAHPTRKNGRGFLRVDRFCQPGLTYADEPRQLRLDLEDDWFVYIARMNSDVSSYADKIWSEKELSSAEMKMSPRRRAEVKSLTAVKIGCSRDPVKRAMGLKANTPYAIELIMHSYPMNKETAHKVEKEFHERLNEYLMRERRGQREWFALPAREIEKIKNQFEDDVAKLQNPALHGASSVCILPSKCGSEIKQKNLGIEPWTYHPLKIFMQGNFKSAEDINTYNWAHIALGKQTRKDHPGNDVYSEEFITGFNWPPGHKGMPESPKQKKRLTA